MFLFFDEHAGKILWGWVILLAVLYSSLSVIRHDHFQSGGFDFGIYDQAVWQYSAFIYPYNTVKERFILGDHLTLNLPLLAPLFWIWDDARTLLVFQATWISLSAVAVYKLTVLRKFSKVTALCLSFLYSLFYGIQFGVFFDFHPVIIGVGLLMWLIYLFESGKKKLFYVTMLLVLTTQENMGLALASLGFMYMFRNGMRKTGLTWIIGGVAVSLIAGKIITMFSPVGFEYQPQISLNPIVNATRYFDNPEKIQVWLMSYGWFSFLPLLSPGAVIAVFFDLAQYFVTGPKFAPMWTPFKHHHAILAVFLIMGMLEVLEIVKKKKISVDKVAAGVLFIALMQQYLLHLPLNKLSKKEFTKTENWMIDDTKLISLVDPNASIASQQNFVPHLSHRKEIYIAWPRKHEIVSAGGISPCGEKECWWLDFSGNPEYLVVDTRPNQWITQTLESPEHWQSAIANMEKAKRIELFTSVGDARMYTVMY